ncbi:hypothetical protein NYQ10_20580 [Flavobacterium johnsoniae]|uniref:hypothetical protein n=1 Tax=Flavobacterium johnsoniae TaxID=986 RepID=UPI0015BD8123|nr:hypothetical protein [Flavobacterium johnsoniae]WJS94481.1 hypothetical protein NYQ10_20580 [Flavobacterium johnsoniae]
MMNNIYPLEWFDSLILQTFDPLSMYIDSLTDNDIAVISENISKESIKIQVHIKNEVFSLKKKRHIRVTVRQYHSTLIFLLDSIMENRTEKVIQSDKMRKLADLLISNLDYLISFIEDRFSYYLSLDERVPITYLMVCRKELALKLQRISKRNLSTEPDKVTIKRVVKILQNAIEAENGKKLTYRRILYFRELLKLLEEHNDDMENLSIFTPLDELLIDHNFNSVQYISILTERMTEQIYTTEKQSAKLNLLLLFFKDFKQLHSNVKITFDASHQNIKDVLENWFVSEISFLQNRDEIETQDISSSKKNSNPSHLADQNKIQCTLSSDQMGLILRATDETRILKAKSMSLIFKTIVPYLSTPFKRNLSYQSVRSKSYNPEEKDKEFVIKTLEKIIKHIKEY